MKISDLEVFLSVANELSFSETARKLYISQSAVSQNIRKTEEELGFSLFQRSKHSLRLTEQGSIVLKNGQKLRHGPYMDFYTGTYRITFDLKSDIGTELGEPLCSVYVVTLDGKSLAENTIETESLNLDGTCSVEVAFKTTDIRYLQFPVFPTAEYTIEVTGIHYQRIG